MMKNKQPRNINEYIACYPPDVQKILQKIRMTIRKAAPGAVEKISYQIPAFALKGNLIHFAGYRTHIGIYPAPRGVAEFKTDLAKYLSGKSTLKFPLDEPIPYDLIARLVKFRVKENSKKGVVKATKKRRS